MRTLFAILLLVGVGSVGVADIHEPPKARYTENRKFARGLSNILYGANEIPTTISRYSQLHTEQSVGVFVGGFFHGVQRTGARWKYGFYELVNFQRPLYKDSYRPPYPNMNYLPHHGMKEFPPQIGFLTTTGYVRGNSW